MNTELVDQLERVATLHSEEGEPYRASAFRKAAKIIKGLNFKVSEENLGRVKKLPGIGATLAQVLDQYVETGSIARLKTLEVESKRVQEKGNVIRELLKIHGVGEATAEKLYTQGVRSVEDLELDPYYTQLNRAQRLGLLYFDDLQKRIPRSEMLRYDEMFREIFDELGIEGVIVGSYRRGSSSSGDVDILVQKPKDEPDFNLKEIVKILEEYEQDDGEPFLQAIIVPRPGKPPEKQVFAIVQFSSKSPARRLDLFLVEEENWGTALLHATGSAEFNEVIRSEAKKQGYSLSQYSLKEIETGDSLHFSDEESIFEFLGLESVPPEERTGRPLSYK